MNADPGKRPKILVVEDDEALHIVLRDSFSRSGFEIISAKDGKEGLDMALSEHPDLILLDITMPVMDGITALRELRKDSWGAMVPVFILTNSSDVSKMAETMESHIIQYIVKANVDMAKLVEQVREALSPHAAKFRRGSFGVAPSDETQRIEYRG